MDGWALAVLAVLAGSMASATAVFVRWAAACRTPLRAAVVVFLLLMMVGMLAGGLVYELWPSRQSAVAGLWLASIVMSASVGVVFVAFHREVRRLAGGSASRAIARRPFVGTVIALVLAGETLMGWTFGIAAGSLPRLLPTGAAGDLGLFGRIVASPWFTFPMVLEMTLSLAWLWTEMGAPLARLAAFQPVVMLCSPPAIAGLFWVAGTGIGSGAAMAGAVTYLAVLAHRGSPLSPRLTTYAAALLLALGMMAAGLALWAWNGSLTLFSAAVFVQMAVFLVAVVAPAPAEPVGAPPSGLPWPGSRASVPSET